MSRKFNHYLQTYVSVMHANIYCCSHFFTPLSCDPPPPPSISAVINHCGWFGPGPAFKMNESTFLGPF